MMKLRYSLLILLGSLGVMSLGPACHYMAIAHAAAADPVQATAVAVDSGWTLAETYGPVWAGMALAFGLSRALLKRNESAHWITEGKTLAIITSAVGLGTSALTAHLSGTPWSGVLITAVIAAFNVQSPTVGSYRA